jgi:hypothetical protein
MIEISVVRELLEEEVMSVQAVPSTPKISIVTIVRQRGM